jgi:hypothetical protein
MLKPNNNYLSADEKKGLSKMNTKVNKGDFRSGDEDLMVEDAVYPRPPVNLPPISEEPARKAMKRTLNRKRTVRKQHS